MKETTTDSPKQSLVTSPFDVPCIPQEGEILVLLPQKMDKKGGIILTDQSQSEHYSKLTLTVVAVGKGLEDLDLKQGDEILSRRLYQETGKVIFDLNGVFRWSRITKANITKEIEFIYEYGIMSRHQMLVKFKEDANLSEFM